MYTLTEEHHMIRQSVRDFAEQEIKPVARELDRKEQFSIELTQKMGELGLFGIVVPEEYGGHGLDYLSYIIAVEELARVDGSQAATIAAHNSLGTGPLAQFGTEEQKKKSTYPSSAPEKHSGRLALPKRKPVRTLGVLKPPHNSKTASGTSTEPKFLSPTALPTSPWA